MIKLDSRQPMDMGVGAAAGIDRAEDAQCNTL